MKDRAITVESDGYTMRYEPLEDGRNWKVTITVPARPESPIEDYKRPHTIELDPIGTTEDVLYQVSLVILNHDQEKS